MALVSIFKPFVHQLNSDCLLEAVVRALQSVKTEHKAWVSVQLLRRQEHSSLVIPLVWQVKSISQNGAKM